jgi:phosphoglycerol transferase MdoB-like AlkP superfamily enzyme
MATLITLTSHVPFVIPADLQAVSIPNDAPFDQLQKDYIQSVHYVDAAVGVFIQKLKEMKLYDHSLIVILGDHGSYSNISKAFGTGEYIPDSLRNHQVPLIILAPGTKARGEIKNLASHIDVYPTVTNLLGIAPPQSVFGKDILNEKGGIAVKRKIGTGTVDAMIDSATIYSGSSDAVFEHGTCKGMSSKKTLPIEKCHAMYVQQTSNMRASDIVIRGNLVPLFQNLSAPQAGLARENKKEH